MTIKNHLFSIVVLTVCFGLAGTIQAAPITLSAGDFAASNGIAVPDTFGDTADVDFTWSVNGNLLKWNGDYSGEDAFYCGSNAAAVCVFEIRPLGGQELTLVNFQLGGWLNANRSVAWSVFDLIDTTTAILSDTAAVLGSTPFTVSVNQSSTQGFRVSFGPDGFNGGLVGLTYSVGSATVPAPGPLALLLIGLFATGVMRRRS
ncbi:MAG: PEP-CTERM sorting domain-containing protein [Gammaproteobacteria bacterium]|nr:PEP-CTERM sorting domain-containing protein [Gammaproteobacteria bacterium]